MCGISVLFKWKDFNIQQAIQAMNDLILHRGPDDEGFVFFSKGSKSSPKTFGGNSTPNPLYTTNIPYAPKSQISIDKVDFSPQLAFGHRRLSIIDLSILGHQPMCNNDQSIWITYNGEIYNYLEIREELEQIGYQFRSNTDTEVIIHAYQEWGEKCLQKFNGMFSFAIYDQNRSRLFIARDRFGIKPLYYWISPKGYIAFGSEIKQFTVLPGWQPKLESQMAYDFLRFGLTNHTNQTCFSGVNQVPSSHYLSINLDHPILEQLTPVRWYELPSENFKGSLQEAANHFRCLFKDSVRIRCHADALVGSCLSGGLDSSSIVCIMNQLLKEKNVHHLQNTFSSCSSDKRFDEREFIEEVINHTQVSPHYVYPSIENLLDQLDSIIWHQDEPFASTSIIAQWEVFRCAKKNNVKVMLDGQGADEQLAGYGSFIPKYLYELFVNFRYPTLWKNLQNYRTLHKIPKPEIILFKELIPNSLKNFARNRVYQPVEPIDWINIEAFLENRVQTEGIMKQHHDSLYDFSLDQLRHTSLPKLLHYEDRDSMAHSIEARTPFLDYRLVEFITSLPSDYKISKGISKYVLREGMKGILPETIRNRMSKLGFATPEEVWIKNQSPVLFLDLIKQSVQNSLGLIHPNAIDFAQKMIQGKIPFSFTLWRMIVFSKWVVKFSINSTNSLPSTEDHIFSHHLPKAYDTK